MRLIFCDTETTGTDEHRCEIIELAMIAVEPRTLIEVAAITTLVDVSTAARAQIFEDPKLLAMHTNNGLLAEYDARKHLREGGIPLREQVEAWARDWMWSVGCHTEQGQSPLTGYNPDFDRRFLRVHMPQVEKMFKYRNLDINFPWQLEWLATGVEPAKTEVKHRALDDCRHALATLRKFVGLPNY